MSAPLLKIREELADQIRAHGVETYPLRMLRRNPRPR